MESREQRLAIILLAFPLTTEQFLLREFLELQRQGVHLEIFPLRPKPRSRVPEDARPLLRFVHYTPLIFSWRLWKVNIEELLERPLGYIESFLYLFLFLGNPRRFLKQLALFPKTFLIANAVRRMGIKHVHAHWATTPTGVAMIVSRLTGVGYSFTGHASDIFAPKNRVGLSEKIRRARFVTSCTRYGQQLLQDVCESDEQARKIFLCHHGLVFKEYKAAKKESAPMLIVSGGRLVEKKGLVYLVRALSLLKGKKIKFEAVLIGGGPLRKQLEGAIQLHGLTGSVRLTGFISHEKVKKLLSHAAIFVAPSIITAEGEMDGIPNVLLEAMACRKPVIASAIAPIVEVIEDGVDGYVVPERDVKKLAEKIQLLLLDEKKRHQMGEAGRKKVEAQFDLAKNVSGFLGLLSEHSEFNK